MPSSTYFMQECPTCSRSLHVPVEYLGKRILCQHCGCKFNATDPNLAPQPTAADEMLERAELLLESTNHRWVWPR